MTGEAEFCAFFEKQPEFSHVPARVSTSLSSRVGYNRAAPKQIFELCIYLYGKDPLHTYTVLTKLSVLSYTTSSFITLVLKKG
jgi:hypothetical protein